MPMHFLLLILALGVALTPGGVTSASDEQKTMPNIVYILADDMGYGDFGANNPASKIPTPQLDSLAADGMRFTDAHAPASVCTPTRYGIMTGEYAFRSKRLRYGALNGYGHAMIEQGRMTVPRLLQGAGYTTGIIGKWHLGLNWKIKPEFKKEFAALLPDKDGHMVVKSTKPDWVDFSKQPTDGPVTLGFDYSYILPASLDFPPYTYLENDQMTEVPTEQIEGRDLDTGFTKAFYRGGLKAPSFDFNQVLPNFTQRAANFIEEKAKSDKPYFLYVPLPAPHTPWLPAEKFNGVSGAGMYGDFMAMVDDAVGQIIAAVENSGEARDTLIIFTSDNGPFWQQRHKDTFGHNAAGIYRGMKGDTHEAGHRMPYVVKWPAKVAAGSVSDHITTQTNLMATVAEIVGQQMPMGAGKDSKSIVPILLGGTAQPEILIHQSPGDMFAIRDGDWKFIDGLGSGGFTKPRTIKPTPGGPKGQLYNMATDPIESENLYLKHPEIVARLRVLLAKKRQ